MEYFFKIFPFPTSSCPECNLDPVKTASLDRNVTLEPAEGHLLSRRYP